ncbi:MAG: gamma-glutamyl-gamma-aminobutyrate hydrolase family protein [Chloroflexi bacterium]|nr:gamma-glutamyl-gamma-aminobutyrate hydrolase family protein [Chloroflexota bacterium]
MPTVWALQHFHCETLGSIADALEAEGVSWRYVRTFAGQAIPEQMGDAAGLVVMGGPMGVYERSRYPFLLDEIRLIEQALRNEKPVLGVCLGSQLLAATLGARVAKGSKKEIGWHSVTLTEAALEDPLWRGVEAEFKAYHWHGDVFELPTGAVSLASSALTTCQAFRFGRNAYGLLFHMEVTPSIIEDMVGTFADELREEGIDGRKIVAEADDHLPRLEKIGATVFRRWARLIEGETS